LCVNCEKKRKIPSICFVQSKNKFKEKEIKENIPKSLSSLPKMFFKILHMLCKNQIQITFDYNDSFFAITTLGKNFILIKYFSYNMFWFYSSPRIARFASYQYSFHCQYINSQFDVFISKHIKHALKRVFAWIG